MREIGAFEAKNKLGQLLDEVERGAEILITRRGREVARLVPASRTRSRAEAKDAFQRLRQRAEKSGLGRFDWTEWRLYRDEGRP